MPNINQVILAGHLGRDAETKYTPNGKPVTNFSLATSRRWKQGEEWKESTDWHSIVAWSVPESKLPALVKGAAVMVTGRISTRTYEKDGTRHYVTEIVADRVWPLSGRKGEDVPATAEAPVITDEDVPF